VSGLFVVLKGFFELQSAGILGSTLRLISQYFWRAKDMDLCTYRIR